MRLATINHNGNDKVVAVLDDDRLLDLAAAANGPFATMLDLIDAGNAGLAQTRALVDDPKESAILSPSDVQWRAPLPEPRQFRDCLVFEEHLLNSFANAEKMTGRKMDIPQVWYDQPIYYKANRFSVIGHGEDIRWPAYSNHMDYELELAIVIGKNGTDIAAKDGGAHIFGYTIFNDMSARDAQMKEMAAQLGPAKGKDFDTGNILGPVILTADEVPMNEKGQIALDMEVRVNGERWGGGNAASMHHTFGDVLAHISSSETIYAGEVIGSGTVGTGCGLEIGKQLSDGDTIELEIEKIGILRNTIRKHIK
jgi:2-keto-4-pentenoate hydratase/2-oxohepta-3-ene-1,7-dioic acid hydratase in catechol pathway